MNGVSEWLVPLLGFVAGALLVALVADWFLMEALDRVCGLLEEYGEPPLSEPPPEVDLD